LPERCGDLSCRDRNAFRRVLVDSTVPSAAHLTSQNRDASIFDATRITTRQGGVIHDAEIRNEGDRFSKNAEVTPFFVPG
jgi:hypothetical protein